MTQPAAWRTDEPCPVCATGLTVVEEGGPVLRAECRLCGYAETWIGGERASREW